MALRIESAGLSDTGQQRTQNEDSILLDPEFHYWVVADGMGGHAAGMVASQLAVQTMAEIMRGIRPREPHHEDAEPLVVAVRSANSAVFNKSMNDPACRGMGTTVVAVRQEEDLVHLCHVGDSRIYMLRGGQLSQATRDHSLANLYEDQPQLAGTLGPAHSNVIVRAVGLREHVDVDHRIIAIEPGDQFLLCCDGMTDMVDDWIIREMLTAGESSEVTCQNLVRAANANGGADNISVILLRIHETS
jgi:protein phosphatase